MIWGLSTPAFTFLHVVLSVVGIASGLLVVYGLIAGKRFEFTTAVFLVTTVLTSVTGFGFPFDHLLPSHKVGIVSLTVLAVAALALYAFQLRGGWRRVYAISAVLALYLNVFVLVVQLFRHVMTLNALAPTQTTEPAFVGTQVAVLAIFLVLGVRSVSRSRPGSVRTA
jgi:hypothetical protein